MSCGLTDSMKDMPYMSSQIHKLFQMVNSLATLTKPSTDTVLATHDSKSNHNHRSKFSCCTICHALRYSCQGHTKEWCIRPGSRMARKTIDKSKAACKAVCEEETKLDEQQIQQLKMALQSKASTGKLTLLM